jgi:hypothetical protein
MSGDYIRTWFVSKWHRPGLLPSARTSLVAKCDTFARADGRGAAPFCRFQAQDWIRTTMTVLPIVERELRVAARSSRTYWSRALVALVVIVLTVFIFDSYERFGRSKVGGSKSSPRWPTCPWRIQCLPERH